MRILTFWLCLVGLHWTRARTRHLSGGTNHTLHYRECIWCGHAGSITHDA